MKVLIIGSGGREHALVWKTAQSKAVDEVFCAPGNAGTAQEPKCQNIPISASETARLIDFSLKNSVKLAVFGPEDPLVAGAADVFRMHDISCFGPSIRGAWMEGSKSFTKDIMIKHGIPTAPYRLFTDPDKAEAYIRKKGTSVVIKADGLTGGKGVNVFSNLEWGLRSINEMMRQSKFGMAGKNVVIEKRLHGRETSFMNLVDRNFLIPLASSEDHKALYDGDRGPNTGGIGAVSPGSATPEEIRNMEGVAQKFLEALIAERILYRGLCYFGFMMEDNSLNILEINCRFGDPETQPVLFRMKSDIVPYLLSCAGGALSSMSEIEWDPRPAVCIVLVSEGYPGNYDIGKVITGLDEVAQMDNVKVFHAGTKIVNNRIITAGGRVLGVTALGNTMKETAALAYEAAERIYFDGKYCRRDIPRFL